MSDDVAVTRQLHTCRQAHLVWVVEQAAEAVEDDAEVILTRERAQRVTERVAVGVPQMLHRGLCDELMTRVTN